MVLLAHGTLGYLDELLPFFLIIGFTIILAAVALLSRKTDTKLTNQNNDQEPTMSNSNMENENNESANTDQGSISEHFRLD